MSSATAPHLATPPDHATMAPDDRRIGHLIAMFLAGGVIAANAAFIGLGSSFDYPKVLGLPIAEVFQRFDATRGTTMAWFVVLAVSAATLAPASVLLGRRLSGRAGRWIPIVGVAAAVVQVIGLSRWFIIVPSLASRALDPSASGAAQSLALDQAQLAHRVLGTMIGETLGYTLTALWTVLLVVALGDRSSRTFNAMGSVAAAMILSGVLVPLGVGLADMTNFVGYIIWSAWALWLAVRLWRAPASLLSSCAHERVGFAHG